MTKEQIEELEGLRKKASPLTKTEAIFNNDDWQGTRPHVIIHGINSDNDKAFMKALVDNADDLIEAAKQRDHYKQTLAKIAELLCDVSDEGHDKAEALAYLGSRK